MHIQSIGLSPLFRTANMSQGCTVRHAENQQIKNILLQNKDTLSLSAKGKKNSFVKQLMDQKKFLTELKDYTIQKGLKNGYMDKGKLEEYDKQLKALDEQIAKVMMEEAQKNTEETAASAKKKTMTKEEYERQKMTAIMDLSSDVSHANIVISAKENVDNETNVLQTEIKLDISRSVDSKIPEGKTERVAELQTKSSNLMQEIQGRLNDINTSITANRENVEIEEDTDTNQTKKIESNNADNIKEQLASLQDNVQNLK